MDKHPLFVYNQLPGNAPATTDQILATCMRYCISQHIFYIYLNKLRSDENNNCTASSLYHFG